MKNKKVVLIAEDDPSLLKALSMVLDQEFDIHTAENGKIAWEMIKTSKIDCLITDIDMPEMTGLELIRKMRINGFNNKVIVTTGSYKAGLKQECEKLGIIDFLTKPYNMFGLKKIINADEEPFMAQGM